MEDGPEIPVPPYFLCPISLQIMKDPVTVSTGITYDRESISRWLSIYGHNSCPATNQPLADDSLTPNSTLLRLIQSWAAANNTSNLSVRPPKQRFNVTLLLINELAKELRDPQLQIKSLRKIKALVQENDDHRTSMEEAGITLVVASLIRKPRLSETNNSLPLLLLDPFDATSPCDTTSDEATALLHFLSPSPETLKRVAETKNGELIGSLSSILHRGSYRARIHAALLLQSIFKLVDDNYKSVLQTDLFDGMVELIKDQNSDRITTMAVLAVLMEVIPYGRNQAKAVESGVVMVIVDLLAEERDDRRRCEVMLAILEQLCKKADGRSALLDHPAGVAAVAGKILAASHIATSKAVKVLSLVSIFCRSGRVVEEMMEVGAVAKLCMVVQVEGSTKTRQKAMEILGLNWKTWNSFPCFPLNCLP